MNGSVPFFYARRVLYMCLVALCVSLSGTLVFAQDSTEREPAAEELLPEPVSAQPLSPYSVTPVVLNEKAKPRDILKKELLLTNNTEERVDLYIAVKNINPDTGDQVFEGPSVADTSVSLANWIEITRGVIELAPGESRKVPYLIHVNMDAKHGSYFARIAFHKGRNRMDAESKPTDVELVLNLEVLDDANERLQLAGFTSDASIALGKQIGFSYSVANVGNRSIEPRGSIRIFNRRGEEVGSVPVNVNGEAVTPEQKAQLASVWATEGRFGKYKAFLDLEYGESQVASVQDTVYFWVFPWREVFTALVGMFVLAVVGTYVVHLRSIARVRTVVARVPSDTAHDSSLEQYLGQVKAKNVSLEVPQVSQRRVALQEVGSAPVRSVRSRVGGNGGVVTLTSREHVAQVSHGDTVQLTHRRNRSVR